MKVLFYGGTGWIGGQVVELMENDGWEVIKSTSRLENYVDLVNDINTVNPSHVVNCAGLTGRPNVDWCEDHKQEVMEVNVIGTSVLADLCYRKNIHYTYLATGCIFEYDSEHLQPESSTVGCKGFLEEDKPNFDGSFYSFGKIMTENIAKTFPTSLILRIRMPISDDLHPRSFITKITKYQKVVNIPNSMSVLHDLLPLIPKLIRRNRTGIWNFTNPGVISHNQVLSGYKEFIDPDFTWENFTLEEQSKVIKAPRSNNYLDSNKLSSEFPDLPDIQTSIINVFKRMSQNSKQ